MTPMPRWVLLTGLASLAAVGCQPATTTPAAPAPVPAPTAQAVGFDLATARIVDLTHGYGDDTVYWPTSPSRFELDRLAYGPTDGGYFYSANAFSTPEHGGTHLDAPIHFAEDRRTAAEVPLEQLVGPAVVIDITVQAAADPDYRLTVDDVREWESRHGDVPPEAIILLRTGWDRRWPDPRAYLGDDTPGDASNLHFPSFGLDAARYLIEERHATVLGVDTASIDHGPSTDFPVHRLANGANVSGLENVANLGALPEAGAWVVALPMKIKGGSGAPVRIAGFIPRP